MIRPVVAVIKSLASALSIGTGAAVGREGFDHPDRRRHRLDARAIRAHGTVAAHYARCRRRRRRHRRHLQYAALLLYALLGALIGIAAAGFIRGLSFAEDTFERIRNPYLRNFVGMLSIGVMIYAFMIGAGHYFVEGVGYSTVQAILAGGLDLPELLILLFAAKLAATSISLGAGSSGGSFSPSLFMGATLGAAFGVLVEAVHPMESFGTTTCAVKSFMT